jgi:uncharacterized protein YndB with AHSA1/START domain
MARRELTEEPVMRTGMLIRRPAAEVYEAFVDPAVTTQFWFTRSSGRLELGKAVRWDWEMYGASAEVTARVLEPGTRIVIEWPSHGGRTTVEWRFLSRADGSTFVHVVERGFQGSGDELLRQVTDSTQGFTIALAGLKALLEHGIRLNLVGDRFPPDIQEPA